MTSPLSTRSTARAPRPAHLEGGAPVDASRPPKTGDAPNGAAASTDAFEAKTQATKSRNGYPHQLLPWPALGSRALSSLKQSLRSAALVHVKQMKGSAGSTLQRADDGSGARGLVKRRSDEDVTHVHPLRANITPGTWYLREAAVYELSEATKLNLVPPTVLREVDGEPCSVQFFCEGFESPPDDVQLERGAAERMRAFDYLIGNTDRANGNLLAMKVDGKWFPVLIDHGFSLPEGAPMKIGAGDSLQTSHLGPLLPSTREWIANIEPDAVLGVLASSGLPKSVVSHAMKRLARLQKDPSFLEVPPEGSSGPHPETGKDTRWFFLSHKLGAYAELENQGLGAETIASIDARVNAAMRHVD